MSVMHHRFLLNVALPLFVGALFLASPAAEAARVEKVKGKQVLIDTEGEDIQAGSKYFIMIDGKKKGVVLIDKTKGGKAIGKLTKGKAVVDAGIEAVKKKGDASASADAAPDETAAKSAKRRKRGEGGGEPGLYVGVLVGFASDSQSVKDTTGASVSMSGYGYSLKAFGDMPISGRLGLIGRGGIEQLSLSGDTGGVKKNTSIMYATADLLLRYSFSDSGLVPFVAGGLGLHFPISKSSDVLDVPRISSTTVGFLGGGINYPWSDSMNVTLLAEYGMFPPSNDVSTKFIAVRGGASWRF